MNTTNVSAIEHYKRLIDLMPEPSVITTISGDILAFNRAAANFLDISSATNLVAHSPLPAELLHNYLRRCSRNKELLVGAFEMKTRHGEMVVSLQGAAIQPRSAETEALLLVRLASRSGMTTQFKILRDQIGKLNDEAGRRQRAEYDLRTQKKWLEVTLASIGDAVITTDTECKITYLNPVAETMTGWRNAEAAGRLLSEVFVVVNEDSLQPVENPAEKVLRDGCVVALANHTSLIARDGRVISIEDTAAPITQDNRIYGVVLVFHDVSERRNLEKQLLKRARALAAINKRKNEFLTILAHELRSPLTPISNALNLLTLRGELPASTAEPLAVINRQMRHLRRLVDDLLDVARITRGKMKITRETHSLPSLVQSVCEDFREQFAVADITFTYFAPNSDLWVSIDPHRITQALHNVLTNALKFTPAGESVHLQIKAAEEAEIVITDTGIGIDESLQASLFEPFSQAQQNLDRSKGGLGIGLSLVRGIMTLHGGSVAVASEGLNRGTTVTLKLPRIESPSLPAAAKSIPTISRPQHILLIEDEVDAAKTMSELLTLMGHKVSWASTGAEGLRKAAAFEPDLILCDIGLPELNGFEVAKELRQNPLTTNIPLVALTGYGGAAFVQKAMEAGFLLHITKPANVEDIEKAVLLADHSRA